MIWFVKLSTVLGGVAEHTQCVRTIEDDVFVARLRSAQDAALAGYRI